MDIFNLMDTFDDISKKIYERVAEAINIATENGIKANTVIINSKYKKILPFACENFVFPLTILGCDLFMGNVPGDCDFAIFEKNPSDTEAKINEIRNDCKAEIVEYIEELILNTKGKCKNTVLRKIIQHIQEI